VRVRQNWGIGESQRRHIAAQQQPRLSGNLA
jgi:hypothetical protein